ncbi:HAD family hydrolase [Arcobacter cloacae]|uniref:Uncharacterized protein n=1 Tax=Arcobacter cloacae TaxID=1054034 RepID=A0A6M8NHZ5_9BACT|nr:HAD-IA family hydrolase [Arcobacter cloacae]QKF90945.1 HAD superfamily hydrolase [Arcobacter cloacae]RXI43056.1 hypothetical protein CP963_00350 [Arcobacter cloacae]
MIKSVLFDLDNTLYDEDEYFKKVFKLFALKNEINYSKILEIFDDNNFRIRNKDLFSEVLKEINFYTEDRQNELFELYKSIDCSLKLYDDAINILGYLRRLNIKVVVITNGVVEVQRNKVKSLSLDKYVDFIVYAREKGIEYEKPHSYSFEKALELVNSKNNEVIYIGDHPYTDIVGAEKLKIKTLRFLNGYASNIVYDSKLNIKSLIELKKYIR